MLEQWRLCSLMHRSWFIRVVITSPSETGERQAGGSSQVKCARPSSSFSSLMQGKTDASYYLLPPFFIYFSPSFFCSSRLLYFSSFSTITNFISKIWRGDFRGSSIDGSVISNYILHKMFWDICRFSWFMTILPIWMLLTWGYCEGILFLSEVKWVTVKFLGIKVPCTLGWPYTEGNW